MTPLRPRDGLRRARSRWASLSGNSRLKLYVIAAGILVVLWTVVPFFWMVWASLMTKPEIVEGIVQTIDRPTLDNYARIVGIAETDALFGGQTRQIGLGFLNSLIVALPTDIEHAARIDGCSRLGVLRHVMIPMAVPGISAAFIIAFLFCWNELLFGIILTGGSTAQTLSPALQTVSQNITLFAAASTLSVVPPLLLALVFQRFITRLNIVDPITTREA